jgi:hypothetical protein
MNRLDSELSRLYLLEASVLLGPDRRSRALVLALHAPADWSRLGQVWSGVQQDLDLPAPAIAVSGGDALQLWFSLEQAVDIEPAQAFLQGLQRRYLADLPTQRVTLLPAIGEDGSGPRHAALVPAAQGASGNWSAFVAPDLAPVFADTPWLDMPPGEEGQADLLKRLVSIKPGAFATALAQLAPEPATAPAAAAPAALPVEDDPRRFLLQVMNDASAPLALRIEAAKALLPGAPPR